MVLLGREALLGPPHGPMTCVPLPISLWTARVTKRCRDTRLPPCSQERLQGSAGHSSCCVCAWGHCLSNASSSQPGFLAMLGREGKPDGHAQAAYPRAAMMSRFADHRAPGIRDTWLFIFPTGCPVPWFGTHCHVSTTVWLSCWFYLVMKCFFGKEGANKARQALLSAGVAQQPEGVWH